MRRLVYALLLVGMATPAAADDSWLRGSASDFPVPYVRWSGFYGGGQVGEDFHGVNMRNATGPLIANVQNEDGMLQLVPLPTMSNLPDVNTKGPSFGGFVGYNYQIDDAVLGFELNFNRSIMSSAGSDNETRGYDVTNNNGTTWWDVTSNLQSGAGAALEDYGSLRARAAWAFGSFLPYLFVGLAVAQVDTFRYAYASYTAVDITPQSCGTVPCPPNSLTPTHFPDRGQSYSDVDVSHGKVAFGFSVGAGIDYALTQNIFLRGEFEYLQLSSINDIAMSTASVRVGAGLRF
jgi:outer membrane immunogenic protein